MTEAADLKEQCVQGLTMLPYFIFSDVTAPPELDIFTQLVHDARKVCLLILSSHIVFVFYRPCHNSC